MPEPSSEQDVTELLATLRARWAWVLIVPIIMLGISSYATSRTQPQYQATAGVLLAPTVAQQTLDPTAQNTIRRDLANEISLATSDPVRELILNELGVLPRVSVTAPSAADVLRFTATATTPEDAALHANTWAGIYAGVKQEQAAESISAALENIERRLATLRVRRQELRAPLDELDQRISRSATPETALVLQREYDRLADDLSYELNIIQDQAGAVAGSVSQLELQSELSAIGTTRIIAVASPPLSPSNRSGLRNTILALAIGIALGVGAAILRDSLDQTIKEADDIRAITDVPILASIPKIGGRLARAPQIAMRDDADGQLAESYQRVRSALQFASMESKLETILVTSPNQREGKTTTSANLAWAYGSTHRNTILVDVDFRRPRQHDMFGVDVSPGFSDFILSNERLLDLAYSANEDRSLVFFTAGTVPPNPAGFVGTKVFEDSVGWLAHESDVLIMDGPPVLPVSDAVTMSSYVDGVLLVVKAGATKTGELTEALRSLRQVDAVVVGIVLVGVKTSAGYYGYGYKATAERRATAPKAPSSNNGVPGPTPVSVRG